MWIFLTACDYGIDGDEDGENCGEHGLDRYQDNPSNCLRRLSDAELLDEDEDAPDG